MLVQRMKEAVRNFAILRMGHALAYAILPEKRIPEVALALKLKRLFKELSIDTVIDVGANKGQYRDFLRHRVGFSGQIDSFEPVPDLAAGLLARAVSDKRWTIQNCALGATSGNLNLNIMKNTVFSSFLDPHAIDNERLDAQNTVEQSVSVPVKTLDEIYHDRPNLATTYLKLDTQGFDLKVLEGGRRVASVIPALQTELSFRSIYKGMPSYHDAINAFAREGFSVADMFLVNPDVAQQAIEFDCILVR